MEKQKPTYENFYEHNRELYCMNCVDGEGGDECDKCPMSQIQMHPPENEVESDVGLNGHTDY